MIFHPLDLSENGLTAVHDQTFFSLFRTHYIFVPFVSKTERDEQTLPGEKVLTLALLIQEQIQGLTLHIHGVIIKTSYVGD